MASVEAQLEVQLVYRPHGFGAEAAIPIGTTADEYLVKTLGNLIVRRAEEEVRFWEGIDSGVAALKKLEVERLGRILAFLLPESATEPRPELRLVKPGTSGPPPPGGPT